MEAAAALTADLAEHRRATREAKRQVVQEAKARAAQWVLAGRVLQVVLIAYGLAGYTTEAPATFLAALGRQRGWPQKREDDLSRQVEDAFLAVDTDAFAALTDVQAPSKPEAMRIAIDYVDQWRVARWARQVFVKTGVAPPTSLVLDQFAARRLEWPEELRPPWRGTAGEPRARAFVFRWRLRFGGHFRGKGNVREPVTAAEAHSKAAAVANLLQGVGVSGHVSRACSQSLH